MVDKLTRHNTEFHGMDQELLRKALNVLVKQGKAQVGQCFHRIKRY